MKHIIRSTKTEALNELNTAVNELEDGEGILILRLDNTWSLVKKGIPKVNLIGKPSPSEPLV